MKITWRMFSICFVLRIRGFDRLPRPPTQSAPPTQPLEAGRSRSRSRAGQLLPGASRSVAELSWRGGAVCVCACVTVCVIMIILYLSHRAICNLFYLIWVIKNNFHRNLMWFCYYWLSQHVWHFAPCQHLCNSVAIFQPLFSSLCCTRPTYLSPDTRLERFTQQYKHRFCD